MLSKANRDNDPCIGVSLGILAWNEEDSIESALNSLRQQTIFNALVAQGLRSEVIIVANGCTDRTAAIARSVLSNGSSFRSQSQAPSWRVIEIDDRGKNNAWNLFVHSLSAKQANCLFLMDADILLDGNDTLWNMYHALECSPEATVAVDQPIKDILRKPRKSWRERLSLATSGMTRVEQPQLTGQLYAIRTSVARNIFLPRDLTACEDGFIKSLVCTDFLTSMDRADRVVTAENAAHLFQSYQRPTDLLRNQKRQMIGQTLVHLLVDKYLRNLSIDERLNLSSTLQIKESSDRDWLKRLTAQHLREIKYFWRLFPHLLRFRFDRWWGLSPGRRLAHLPAALVGFSITLLASHLAYQTLRRGSLNYWPHRHDSDSRLAEDGLRRRTDAVPPTMESNSSSEPLAATVTLNDQSL